MAFQFIDGKPNLITDGGGRSEYEYPFTPAGGEFHQFIAARKMHVNSLAANAKLREQDLPSNNTAAYWGYSFGLNHIDGIEQHDVSPYPAADFCGVRMERYNSTRSENQCAISSEDSSAAKQNYAVLCDDQYTGNPIFAHWLRSTFLAGKGGTDNFDLFSMYDADTDETKSNQEMLLSVPRAPEISATFVDRFYMEATGEGIRWEGWISYDFDIDSFDIYDNEQFNPESPKTSIPVSNDWESTGIHYVNGIADVGTNWMPTTRAMAAPSHFLARWPFATIGYDLVIDKIVYRYDQLYI